jgi:hypothetical protein
VIALMMAAESMPPTPPPVSESFVTVVVEFGLAWTSLVGLDKRSRIASRSRGQSLWDKRFVRAWTIQLDFYVRSGTEMTILV